MSLPPQGSGASGAPGANPPEPGVQAPPSGTQGAPANPAPGTQDPQQSSGANNPEAQKYAQEAAAARARLKELEKENKKLNDDRLSKRQKREQNQNQQQARLAELEAERRQLRFENTGFKLAASLGITDMGAALALIHSEHGREITYDEETQQPKNLDKLLKLVLADHPVLGMQAAPHGGSANGANGQPQNGQPQPQFAASSGGYTNPGTGAGRAIGLSREIIQGMTPEQLVANADLINMWLASGGR